jgi:hypothetical protein
MRIFAPSEDVIVSSRSLERNSHLVGFEQHCNTLSRVPEC